MAQPKAPRSFATTGGEGEGSYSHQSKQLNNMASMLQPALMDTLLHHFSVVHDSQGPVHYADFGCSVGANTLGFAKFVVDTLQTKPEMSGRDFVCHFADLPSNDFNTLFKQIPPIVEGGGTGGTATDGDGSVVEERRTWFADGVPGSQYGRLFPRSSLHVAITTLTLHYLSEIPKSVLDKSSPAFNKRRIGVHGSSPATAEAFAEASRKDLRKFFECRAEEMVSGGVLGLYCLGRRDRMHPEIQVDNECIHPIPGVEKSWHELETEGIIAEELLDSFNVPICFPSIDEIQEAIEHPTSEFHIHKLELVDKFRISPNNAEETVFKDAESYGRFFVNMCNSGMRPMATDHLGSELTEILFERIRHNSEKDYPLKKAAGFPMDMSFCVAVLIRK